MNEKSRKTNMNYVDGDANIEERAETEERPHPTPDYVFSVGDEASQSSGVVSLEVGGVHLPNILIDSGATCNLLGKGTWEWLKSRKVQCNTRKEARILFAYGNTKPLPTLGTFTADVMSTDTIVTCTADFVVMNGDMSRNAGTGGPRYSITGITKCPHL